MAAIEAQGFIGAQATSRRGGVRYNKKRRRKGMEILMDTGPAFWLIVTVGGLVLVGVALAYGLIASRRRRENPKK
jgi:hypothetical protein